MVTECWVVESCFLEFMWHVNLKPFLHFLQITNAFKVVGKIVFTLQGLKKAGLEKNLNSSACPLSKQLSHFMCPGPDFLFVLVTVNDQLFYSFSLLWVRHLYQSDAYSRAALVSTMGKTLRGIQRELCEARTRYAQFNIKYVQLELLYEPSYIKPLKLTSWSRCYFKLCSINWIYITLHGLSTMVCDHLLIQLGANLSRKQQPFVS